MSLKFKEIALTKVRNNKMSFQIYATKFYSIISKWYLLILITICKFVCKRQSA